MNRLYLTIAAAVVCASGTLMIAGSVFAQSDGTDLPSAKVAFIKSMAAPGWGHYYIDRAHWTRGQYHIAAEVLFILSFVGLNIHSGNLHQNWIGYARTEAGVDISNRSRMFRLAVGSFNSLEAYNEFQERSRNWDQFIADSPENRWSWQHDTAREKYNSIRNRFERIDRQLPAILGMVVVNRLVAAISAYNRARKQNSGSTATLSIQPTRYSGFRAHLRVDF